MAPVWTLIALVGLSQLSDPDVAAADAAWKRGDLERVLPEVKEALTRELRPADLQRAWELAALTHAAFDREAEAVDAYRHLLGINPAYLPAESASPKVKGYFARAHALGPLGEKAWAPSAKAAAPPAAAAKSASAPPAAVEGSPLYKRWWFWAGLGVVAAAAGGGAYVATRPGLPQGTLGTGALQR